MLPLGWETRNGEIAMADVFIFIVVIYFAFFALLCYELE